MGVLFRARDTHLDRPVAVKVLRPELATAENLERFRREAQHLSGLRYAGVLPVHDIDASHGLHFFIMDVAEGETLATSLLKGRMGPKAVVRLGRDVLATLAAAHARGIVHRDIKPANIFIVDGRAVLGDFGVARVRGVGPEESLTEPGRLIGTPEYMAPEQLVAAPATEASDIYSVGLVLYEAALGRRWPGHADPARADWTGVPAPLRRALVRSLQPAPEDRWPDVVSFRRALSFRLHPLPLAAGVAMAVLLATTRGYAPPLSEPPFVDLAIVPFSGGGGLELAKFTAANLEWSPRWTFRPLRDVRRWWDSAGPNADAIAHLRLRARWWADGAVAAGPAGPALDLHIHDSTGRTVKSMRVPGGPDVQPAWASAIADSIVASTFRSDIREFRELMGSSTSDFEAKRELVAGLDAFAADDWDEAERLFASAYARDPALLRAPFELDFLLRWRRKAPTAAQSQQFQAVGNVLPDPYGSLLTNESEPNLRRRLDRYEELDRAYPATSRVRFFLLNETFQRGPLLGIGLDSALHLLGRAMASDPYLAQVAMYDHKVWGYVHLGNRDSARAALTDRRALVERSGRPETIAALLDLTYSARFQPIVGGMKSWLAEWKFRGDPAPLVDYLRLGLTFDVPDLQLRLGRAVAGSADRSLKATGQMAQALALAELGRMRAALPHFDSAAMYLGTREARLQAAMWRVIPPALGLPAGERAEMERAADTLVRLAADSADPSAQAAWALGVAAYSGGDTAGGARAEDRLRALDGRPGVAYLAAVLRALGAGARSQHDSAVALSDTLFIDDGSGALGGPFARASLYLGRGHWQRALGRRDAADASWLFYENSHLRGWPRGVTQAGEADAVLSVMARLLRAELALERSDTAKACRLVSRVRELWSAADPGFGPLLERAGRVAGSCR